MERDEQVLRTGWRSAGESSEQISRGEAKVSAEAGGEAGPTYTVQGQGLVGGAADTGGGEVEARRRRGSRSPSCCRGGGGGGGGGCGVIFAKVRDKLPSWFSSSPEGYGGWVGLEFVRSQPGIWQGRNYL